MNKATKYSSSGIGGESRVNEKGKRKIKCSSGDLRSLLSSFVNHKSKLVDWGYTPNKMGQLKAITTIRTRLAHVPLHDTQRMINAYHVLRFEIRALLPGTHSRYQEQRRRIEAILDYAQDHNTVNDGYAHYIH